MLRGLNIGDHFGKIAQLQKNPNNMKRGEERRISKVWKKKPLYPNGRNNGLQAYKIVKKPQRKQMGSREPQRMK